MRKIIKTEKIYRVPLSPEMEDEPNFAGRVLQSFNEYDRDGNILLEMNYTSDGALNEKNEYTYDPEGRLMSMAIYGEDGDVLEKRAISRDEHGGITGETIVYLDGSEDTVEYRYDGDMLAEKVQFNDDGETENRETYAYEEGHVRIMERFNEDGEKTYRMENSFQNGVIRESRVWNAFEDEEYTMITTFNSEGSKLEECRYDGKNRLIGRNLYEEDDAGRVVSIVEEDREKKNTTEMEYDDHGRLARQVETDANGQLVSEVIRNYDEEGRLSDMEVLYLNRRMGTVVKNFLVYEYEFYDD